MKPSSHGQNPAMKPRLLITGGSSSLGRQVVRQAVPHWEVMATYWTNPDAIPPGLANTRRLQLDLHDEAAVARCVSRYQPTAIIHTAGSNRPPNFYQLIIDGTRHIVEAATRVGARLVNLSTDVIFDGRNAPYTEAAQPTPLHSYGRAKAIAETVVQSSQANAVTIRTSLIYTLTGNDHTSEWLLKANATGEPVTLFTDEYRSPVWVKSLAAACLELAAHPYQGVLNVAGAQQVNRWELGNKLLNARDIRMGPTIQPALTPSSLRRTRPQDCTLDITLAQRILASPLPGLDDVLAQFA